MNRRLSRLARRRSAALDRCRIPGGFVVTTSQSKEEKDDDLVET
jgi:hypothetical protein